MKFERKSENLVDNFHTDKETFTEHFLCARQINSFNVYNNLEKYILREKETESA